VGGFDSARCTSIPAAGRERGRWLAAVLIVAAIGGTTLTVRLWPVRRVPAVHVVTALAARPLNIIEPPAAPIAASISQAARRSTTPPQPVASPEPAPPMLETTVYAPEPARVVAPVVAAVSTTVEPPASGPEPLLASRRIPLTVTVPDVAAWEPVDEPVESAPGLVELPAVAVTRAVVVAGRGIKSGIRATGAVFKAAF
jgi:hypothetical protein